MRDVAGKRFTFDGDTTLTFEHDRPEGGRHCEAHRFSSIYLIDSNALTGFDEGSDHVTVDLTDFERVKPKNFSVSKTVALSIGVTLASLQWRDSCFWPSHLVAAETAAVSVLATPGPSRST